MAQFPYRWEEVTTKKKAFWIVSAVLMLLVSILVIVHGRATLHFREGIREKSAAFEKAQSEKWAKEQQEKDAFNTSIKSLYSISGLTYSPVSQPYIRGKVVILDGKNQTVDSLNDRVPSNLKATKASDIGTVVLITRGQVSVGSYSTGGNAYVQTADITIIDRASSSKILIKTFRGSDPPSQTTSSYRGESHTGESPDNDIMTYLKGLPQR